MTKYGMASFSGETFGANPGSAAAALPSMGDNTLPPSITCHKLNGRNFLSWSQSVLLFICGRGKDDHLTGKAACSDSNDQKFKTWRSENSMVMSWLINSMNPDTGENFLLYGTAQEIWDAARETYSFEENTSELFAIESILHDLRQEEKSVTSYFTALTRQWQESDMFDLHAWKCPDDEQIYRDIVEKKRVFQFLLGLNDTLDDARGRILGTKPLPSLRAAFSEVRQEESRRKVMLAPS